MRSTFAVVLAACAPTPASSSRIAAPPRAEPLDASSEAAVQPVAQPVVDASAANAKPSLSFKEVVAQWNTALNGKDQAALTRLYGANVAYYGVVLDRSAVIAKVMSALEKSPTFHQTIANDEEHELEQPARVVEFEKRSKGGKVAAYVVIDDATRTIVEESDAPTDDALIASKTCLTYGGRVTLDADLSHAVAPNEDWWSISLARPVCILRGSLGTVDWFPPSLRNVTSLESWTNWSGIGGHASITGFVGAWGRHGRMRFDIEGVKKR